MDLRALTFNIRYDTAHDGPNAWPYRRAAVLEQIRALHCHVIGFQEVLGHQRRDLELGLSDYVWLGRGRERDGQGEQCCLAVRRDFQILDEGTFWLCPTPEVAGLVGWDAALARICTWAQLAKDGRSLWAFNSHWDHRGAVARWESARLFDALIDSLVEPVLLLGDFNATPDSEPLGLLTSRLQDAYAVGNPGCPAGTFHGFGRLERGPRLDYLLASAQFLVIESRICDQPSVPYPSDHFAVYGCFELLP